jgi:hypothetical protein
MDDMMYGIGVSPSASGRLGVRERERETEEPRELRVGDARWLRGVDELEDPVRRKDTSDDAAEGELLGVPRVSCEAELDLDVRRDLITLEREPKPDDRGA